MMMTGEMVKEVFEGGFLESRFGLWSIKVQVLWCLVFGATPSFTFLSLVLLTFGRLFGRQS